ncbi:hypothetical protein DU43_04605 [Methanosarcina mazei]|uniref:Uncharacterized protein n=1 Tax=Methanosarcina mazei TaxID=2209 RepID=A0A0F8I206_METMZ|nr:hypothetical protein DU43_04605 [Methanosarcina mazei]
MLSLKEAQKSSNDVSAPLIVVNPEKPYKICGATTLKNLFTVFGILVTFSAEQRFIQTFVSFDEEVVDYT